MTETDDKGQPNLWLFFYPALGLLGLAQAGHKVTLRVFLEDQFRRRRVETNDKERRRCTKFWWFLVSVVAAIFAQLEPLTGFPFKTLALALISVMMFFFIVFFLGFEQYHNGEIDNDEAPHQGITWRMIIILLRLWVCLSSLSLVSASGSTFFLLEATSLVAHHDNLFAILILANLVRCVEIMVSELSRWATKQLGFRISIVELMRIGMGIGCCILCCNIASIAADDRGGGVMSVYWLIPQFFLLGLVRGFAKDGFQSVFESNVHPPYKIHGRCLGALTTGFGSLLSILCVYIFGMKQFYIFGSKQFQWFQYDLENSRLNKYYNFLSILSVWNGFLYVDLMRSYVGTWFLMEDAEMQKAYLDHKQKMG
ncbi:protein NRT1/ PTR FAMILY 5.6-like [Salvia splendens]|nr:protein NRT1/ PTR FAMILY 5.6-like [Salvia splendens]